MIRASSSNTRSGIPSSPFQRIQRIPQSSPIPIKLHASTSASPRSTSPASIACSSPAA